MPLTPELSCGEVRFEPGPLITICAIPERRWMAGIRHDQESSAAVEANGHHSGVVDPIEFHHDGLVEIPHETLSARGP